MSVKAPAMQPLILHAQLQAAVSQLGLTASAISLTALWLLYPSRNMQLLGVAAAWQTAGHRVFRQLQHRNRAQTQCRKHSTAPQAKAHSSLGRHAQRRA